MAERTVSRQIRADHVRPGDIIDVTGDRGIVDTTASDGDLRVHLAGRLQPDGVWSRSCAPQQPIIRYTRAGAR